MHAYLFRIPIFRTMPVSVRENIFYFSGCLQELLLTLVLFTELVSFSTNCNFYILILTVRHCFTSSCGHSSIMIWWDLYKIKLYLCLEPDACFFFQQFLEMVFNKAYWFSYHRGSTMWPLRHEHCKCSDTSQANLESFRQKLLIKFSQPFFKKPQF